MATSKDVVPLFFRDGIVYREWGYYLARLNKFNLSEYYFEKAIKQGQHGDLRTYLGLCRAQICYARYIRGTATTKQCIKIDPTYSHVKQMQLATLFQVGEFEFSMVHAYQGYKKRQTTALKMGILQGNETVEGCVGRNTHPKALLLLSPWIRDLQDHRKMMIEKMKEEVDELAGKKLEKLQLTLKIRSWSARGIDSCTAIVRGLGVNWNDCR